MRSRLRSRILAVGLCSLGWCLGSVEARAQATSPGFALDQFNPADRGSDWFQLDSIDLRGTLRGAAGLTLDWGYLPLVEYNSNGTSTDLIQNQIFAHVGGSIIFLNRFRLGFSLPIALYANGTAGDVGGTVYGGPAAQALGDLRLGGDVRIVGTSVDPFTLAAGFQVFVPTGSQSAYAGDGQSRILGRVEAAGKIDWFVYAARLGWEWRPDAQVIGGAQTGSDLQAGLSIGAKLVNDALTIGPEVYGSTTAWSTSTLFTAATTPLEGILGAHYQIGDFKIGAGVGPGFTRGYGSPELRTLVSFDWAPLPKPADRDGDGILDADDACPDTPGIHTDDPKTNGCPPPPPPADRDHDGIPDAQDACPDVPGVRTDDPKTNGCPLPPPDRDHDGIPDAQDACPDVPGIKTDDPTTNGCPPPADRDHDGIPDAQDACPDVPGVRTDDPKTNGCPKDTDGDGVPDATDNCPTEPGPASNQGCPLKKKQLVVITKDKIEIHDKVFFATGKATIQKRSFKLLDQVAEVLNSHPDIAHISVEGHTDNQGKAESNRTLSQVRAESVRDYLVKKGVSPDRLEAHGFGPDRPIDSNSTSKGRANNRRVEFRIPDADSSAVPLSP